MKKIGAYLQIVDDLLSYTVLRLIPRTVSPNSVTVVRFISVPVVIVLLLLHNYSWGMAVFAFAAFTDAIDGAMARTRNQITKWGKIADPLADKLLIGSTALIVVTQYMGLEVALFLVGIELLFVVRAVRRYAYGLPAGANAVGKAKMVVQSIALLILFVYILSGIPLYLTLATWGIFGAIFLALMSLFLAPSD